MDVWFDSGSSWAGVAKARKDLAYPADLYLEGETRERERHHNNGSVLSSSSRMVVAVAVVVGTVVSGDFATLPWNEAVFTLLSPTFFYCCVENSALSHLPAPSCF